MGSVIDALYACLLVWERLLVLLCFWLCYELGYLCFPLDG